VHNGYIVPVASKVELDFIARFSELLSKTASRIQNSPCTIEVRPLETKDGNLTAPRKAHHASNTLHRNSDEPEKSDTHTSLPSTSLVNDRGELPPRIASDSSNSLAQSDAQKIQMVLKIFKGNLIETRESQPILSEEDSAEFHHELDESIDFGDENSDE